MGGLYRWVGSILCYLIFVSVVRAVLPSKKYEKYIRFFIGVVLILLVVQPVTGGLGLEDRLAYYFEAISFQQESEDLKREILGIEEQRLWRVIEEYEGAVERDVKVMAEDMGFLVNRVEVSIESESQSENYGAVSRVFMVVGREVSGETRKDEPAEEWEKIQIGTIEIEPVDAGGRAEPEISSEREAESAGDGSGERERGTVWEEESGRGGRDEGEMTREGQDGVEERGEDMGDWGGEDLEQLRRKVERYYGLESWQVEIQLEGR